MKVDSIYEQYKKDVYYYLYYLSRNQEIAEDLTSEVFLQAIKSLHTFKGDSTVKTWLFGIARLKWLECIRKEKRNRSLNEKLALYINEQDYFYDDHVVTDAKVNRALTLLQMETEKAKQIVFMRIDGFSFVEIANKLCISESSARVIDFRTKKKLQQQLRKEGYDES